MIIIPSGRPKIWDKHPDSGATSAKIAYTGTFHTLCREYAESQNEEYLILSPKFGFLKPDDSVPHTYDVRFTQKGVNEETISLEELKKQWTHLHLDDKKEIIVLGGKKFKPLMEKISKGSTHQFIYPLHGFGGIGYMQAALKEAIQKGEPL